MKPSPVRSSRAFAAAAAVIVGVAACAAPMTSSRGSMGSMAPVVSPPTPDPRVGLRAGLLDAEQVTWNMRLVSATPPARDFIGVTNSDLAFTGNYAIQGSYNGYQIWDISNPSRPTLTEGFVCPASQSDVSVYGNLLFVSGEGLGGRLDCGTEGVQQAVSHDRLRGIRIFDITDIRNPRYVSNVQTCRGSHTHTLLEPRNDPDNVYVYVSGSSSVRPSEELPGCISRPPSEDPNSALFRIEVIRVPLARPQDAAIVSSPRIFQDLVAPAEHGLAPADLQAIEDARAQGAFIYERRGTPRVLPGRMAEPLLDSIVEARGGRGAATAADSAALRRALPAMMAARFGNDDDESGPQPGPTQCHDITVYPAIDRAGGACGGYGMLLDISDPVNPRRIDEAADSNFSYWHSATFNNDGTKVLFSDEWGGGSQPKCRASDPYEWGADAIFTIENGRMEFQEYYKLSAAQTSEENCVAHNGSLIPIPGRDVMAQAFYQGGITVFDWTDPMNPVEIAYFDRGPVDASRMVSGGSWSVYWYNGVLVSSEIARGLDIMELTPSEALSQNEIDAAKSVHFDHLNAQGQPKLEWPATFSLARAYLDQLERMGGMSGDRISAARSDLTRAEGASGSSRRDALNSLASRLEGEASGAGDPARVRWVANVARDLAGMR